MECNACWSPPATARTSCTHSSSDTRTFDLSAKRISPSVFGFGAATTAIMRRAMLRVKRRTLAFVPSRQCVAFRLYETKRQKSAAGFAIGLKNGVISAAKKHFLQSANPKSNRWRLCKCQKRPRAKRRTLYLDYGQTVFLRGCTQELPKCQNPIPQPADRRPH
jgi:hypothetical protein